MRNKLTAVLGPITPIGGVLMIADGVSLGVSRD